MCFCTDFLHCTTQASGRRNVCFREDILGFLQDPLDKSGRPLPLYVQSTYNVLCTRYHMQGGTSHGVCKDPPASSPCTASSPSWSGSGPPGRDGFAYRGVLELDGQGPGRGAPLPRQDAGVGIAGFNGDAELSLIDPAQREAYLDFLKRSVEAAVTGGRPVRHHPLQRPGRGRPWCSNSYPELSDTVKLCTMFGTLRALRGAGGGRRRSA